MTKFIKKNILIVLIFLITLSLGFVTFLTFIGKSFIPLSDNNLQSLLVLNIIFLLIFFIFIFIEVKSLLKNNIKNISLNSSKKYLTYFSLFTLIPSILISIFSLFLFSFALEKYLDKKISSAVNNSFEIAKSYVDNVKNQIESDIILAAYDLNKNIDIFYDNKNTFRNMLKTQKLARNIDKIYLIDSSGNLIISTNEDQDSYTSPNDKALELVFDDERPIKIINTPENESSAIIKLNAYIDTYLYIINFLDLKISNYLRDSQEALTFYYTVENKTTGIKISFMVIYILVVSLMLFLSISIAIKFSSKFFLSINNLIYASSSIGKGNLDIKVPEIETDKELKTLNKNFNLMIEKLKSQQEKLILNERHEAWDNVARKLAHEIKNPLTPIQLTIDRLKNKYLNQIPTDERINFNDYLQTIFKQIKQIENLVNEFSDFARMPKPIFKSNDLISLINLNINLLKEIDNTISINLNFRDTNLFFIFDNEQISRVFLNLIKNSIESIQEKSKKISNFDKKIDIEIFDKDTYITINITDTGIGFTELDFKNITKPYYTTKAKGSGLGLSIVNKIVNDHNGSIKFKSLQFGAKINIILPKNVS